MRKFDLAVIGGGPGGYVAAIRAAQAGFSVALIEMNLFGGTCLNWGCIPTKSMLAGAEVLQTVRQADKFAVTTGEVSFDYPKMVQRTGKLVASIRKSLESLIASNQITVLRGFGKFVSPREIKVTGKDNEVFYAEKTIIATGSEPRNIQSFSFDGKLIHSSSSILQLTTLPKKLVIVGGGVIGCEFASLYHDLGVEVVILELLPEIIMQEGKKISHALTTSFRKRGIDVRTGVQVEGIEKKEEGVFVKLLGEDGLSADMALVAVGRRLNTDNIDLEKAGLSALDDGTIAVNDQMETDVLGIYAIGDVTGKFLLAHVASHQGIVAADNALGKKASMHYQAVPSVTFTRPEIATVGMTLQVALEQGHAATEAMFPFQALGKSQASMDTEGFALIVTESSTGQILGAQVMGHGASILIAEMTLAINNELTIDCIIETIHAHPSIAEAWLEAALIAGGTPLHMPPRPVKKERNKGKAYVQA